MGVSFSYAKNLAKTGTRLLIGLLVFDTAWSLIHFILFNTTFLDEYSQTAFSVIESIITNLLFTISITILCIGMMMFSIYYSKFSKIGIIASTLLLAFIGIKIAFIFFRFTQLLGDYSQDYMEFTFHIFELTTGFLLIITFIVYDIFQINLKRNADIGYGRSPFPYIFGFFAIIYPIANILSLFKIQFVEYSVAFSIMRTLAFIASILEILLYFDLLRRFDRFPNLATLQEIKKEEV